MSLQTRGRRAAGRAALGALALIGALAAGVILTGCGGEDEVEQATQEAAQTAEQLRQAEEAARRQAATGELAGRVEELTSAAAGLREELASRDLPESLEGARAELAATTDAPAELLEQLRQAQGEQWEQAKAGLEEALAALEASRGRVQEQLSDWTNREQAALAARDPLVLPIDRETGLLEGLDGGEYPHYAVHAVERVQRALRRAGLYAGPVDGTFDVTLREAVGRFQKATGLHASGVPSPLTRAALFAEDA